MQPTWQGVVAGIFVAPRAGEPRQEREQVRALTATGLDGDHYAAGDDHSPVRQVTLIESEAIAAANRDYGLRLEPGETRRNLVTAGVPLNHLVGREFNVGEARLRGVELCEPCGRLKRLTGQDVVRALRHRGGLNAEVIDGGVIRVGDPVYPAD